MQTAAEMFSAFERISPVAHGGRKRSTSLWAYATFLLFMSPERELVKIGLSLLAVEVVVHHVTKSHGTPPEMCIIHKCSAP